jgi:outer membrane protein insertion porin family
MSRMSIFSVVPVSVVSPAAMLCAAALAMLPCASALAFEPFAVQDIRVEGLQRADAGTVFAALPFRVGDTINDAKAAAGLRALFAIGLFKDVRIDIDGKVVVVVVDERAVIANIDFVGLKEFDKDVLLKALKDFGVGEEQPFDKSLADRAEQELKRQYLTRSLYGAEVVTTVTPQERNRVNLTFTLTEGGPAKIRAIRIVGNQAFSEAELKGQFDLTRSGWLSWYTKGDRYARTKLAADLETLRAYYLNRGYLEFAVESTQVAISPDKQDITITINVSEGQRYVVTDVKLEGDYLGKLPEFQSLVRIAPGKAYQADAVATTTKAFTDHFGSFGYAFARVEARSELDRSAGRVVVVLSSDPQRRVYVRRFNVAGNSKTRDEVVRREFRQFESSWYDGRRIKLSRDRVDRLGYFKDVSVETNEVPGLSDQVDLTLNVVEKATGSLTLGAGFSSAERFSISGSIKQDNVFGSGTYLGIDVNTGKYNRTYSVSAIDPYYTINGVSRAFDVFYRTTRPVNSQGEDYELVTPGVGVRYGVPFSEQDTVFFGLGAEQTRIKGNTGLPNAYRNYRTNYGDKSSSIPLTLGWARDGRDSPMVPNEGRYQRVNVDWSVGGNTKYVRTNLQFQQYIPIGKKYTLAFNAEAGWGVGLAGREYPVFKNFYGGGLGTVRAFDQNSLGPVDWSGAYIGGARKFNVNAELYLPVPGTGNDRSLRIFTYLDAGNIWGEREKINVDSLRASAGLGLSWVSPIGPLKLSYGVPIRSQPNDRISKFQFQIGTAF